MRNRFALAPLFLVLALVAACGVSPTDPALPTLTQQSSHVKAVISGGSGVTSLILQSRYPAWDPKEGVCLEPYVYLVGLSSMKGSCTSTFSFVGTEGPIPPTNELLAGKERSTVLKLFGINPKGVVEVRRVRLNPSNAFCVGCGVGTLTYTLTCGGVSDTSTKQSYNCKG